MADLIYMEKSKWTALLDSIRTKGGTSALMTADQAKAAVDAIPTGGGGGVTAATGEIVFSSDTEGPGSGGATELFPGLALSFQPDILIIALEKSSFDALDSITGTGMYGIWAIRKMCMPPLRVSANVSTSASDGDYLFFFNRNVIADTSEASGFSLNAFTISAASYADNWSVNADGTLTVARTSSAAWYYRKGTYRYFAVKM